MNVDWVDGIAVVRMDEGRANAIGPDFLAEFDRALDGVEGRNAQALVLTGTGRHFSAGLDLRTLHALDPAELAVFVLSLESAFRRFFLLPVPVVAAVNGNAIAGGCVLACGADERIAARGGYSIGINEVRLGVSLPGIALELPRHMLTRSAFRQAVLGGELMQPGEALELGLIDQLSPPDELDACALEAARAWMRSPREAFAQVKAEDRAGIIERVDRTGPESRRRFCELWFAEAAQIRREAFLSG